MEKSNVKKFCVFFLLILVTLTLPSRFKILTYGFKVKKLELQLPYSKEWEVENTMGKNELIQIFSHPFSFLGKGAQSYVFESSDHEYVLKLFRFDHRKKSFTDHAKWDHWQKDRASDLFSSCKLGFEKAKNETALVYLHLNPTEDHIKVTIIDPLRRKIELDLDHYRFALQKKVKPLTDALEAGLVDGTFATKIESLKTLLDKRTVNGIGNRDPSLWRNFGFLGDVAVEIDFGNYAARPDFINEEARQKEMDRYLIPLRKWIHKKQIALDF